MRDQLAGEYLHVTRYLISGGVGGGRRLPAYATPLAWQLRYSILESRAEKRDAAVHTIFKMCMRRTPTRSAQLQDICRSAASDALSPSRFAIWCHFVMCDADCSEAHNMEACAENCDFKPKSKFSCLLACVCAVEIHTSAHFLLTNEFCLFSHIAFAHQCENRWVAKS